MPAVMNLYAVIDRACRIILLGGLGAGLSACSQLDPHQNFKNMLSLSIGSRADRNILMDSVLLEKSKLPDGNEKRVYRYRDGCYMIFVIDKTTNRVLSAAFDGDEKTCTWNP